MQMMQLNVTTDYAIRTVLYLAIKDELATSNEIAMAMGIPPSYVLKITSKLVVAGISATALSSVFPEPIRIASSSASLRASAPFSIIIPHSGLRLSRTGIATSLLAVPPRHPMWSVR